MNYPCLLCPSDNFEHRVSLPTRLRASVRALFYCYLLSYPRRCEMNRKVRAPMRVSALGASHIVTWIKQTWIKCQCTASKPKCHDCLHFWKKVYFQKNHRNPSLIFMQCRRDCTKSVICKARTISRNFSKKNSNSESEKNVLCQT